MQSEPLIFPLGALAQRKGAAGCRERNDISTSSGVRAYLFKCSCNLTCKVPRKAYAREKGRMGPLQKSASIFIRISLQKIWRSCVRTRHTRAASTMHSRLHTMLWCISVENHAADTKFCAKTCHTEPDASKHKNQVRTMLLAPEQQIGCQQRAGLVRCFGMRQMPKTYPPATQIVCKKCNAA